MKVKRETGIFRVLTGSHLYGTATEKSDFDYKVVCLPDLDDLLLNKKLVNRKDKPEGMKAGDKMIAGETETEYLPLQVFLDDFFNGQTYALEMVFAVAQGKFEVMSYDGAWVEGTYDNSENGNVEIIELMIGCLLGAFLTKNVKKMVGYAISQSKLYGLKTDRYASIKEALKLISDEFTLNKHFYDGERLQKQKVRDNPALLEKLLKLQYVQQTMIANAKGGAELSPALDICGKQHSYTNSWGTVFNSLTNTIDEYGERVKEFEGQGVDWKALSHAIRITEQVLELCGEGKLVFPRPNAKFLLDVKNGKISLDEATAYLNDAFAKVDNAVSTSVLQERTHELEESFEEWKLEVLKDQYGLN